MTNNHPGFIRDGFTKKGAEGMHTSSKTKKELKSFLFVLPHLILFFVFGFLPILFGFYISFTRWDLSGVPQWVGFANYQEILFNLDSTFHFQFFNGMKNTFIFVILTVPLLILIPLLLALAMSAKLRGTGFFQAVFYVPGLFSISAIAIIWLLVFNRRVGPVNNLFQMDVVWTTTQPYAWILILIVTVWASMGGNMIIYRAAISGIPNELYEAAQIDGANSFKRFTAITLPGIRFQLLYTLVMTTLGSFSVYGQPRMLTDGGPVQSTTSIMMYIRELAFSSGKSIAGMGSAMAILLGVLMLIITAFQFRLMGKEE